MVDGDVREWLRQELGEEWATACIGAKIRELLAKFHADDGFIASRDPVRLQQAFDTLVELFKQVGLRTNTTKTKAMIYTPGRIRVSLSTKAYANRMEGF